MFYALLEKSLQCGKSAILLWKKFGIICSYTTHAKEEVGKKWWKAFGRRTLRSSLEKGRKRPAAFFLAAALYQVLIQKWKQPKIKGWSFLKHTLIAGVLPFQKKKVQNFIFIFLFAEFTIVFSTPPTHGVTANDVHAFKSTSTPDPSGTHWLVN